MMTRGWNRETIPKEGAIVYVLAVDDLGPYEIPFPVLFANGWLNASTHQELDAIIAAWRPAEDCPRNFKQDATTGVNPRRAEVAPSTQNFSEAEE